MRATRPQALPASPGEVLSATADYCRHARRLRARFSHDPGRLHRSLRNLSGVVPAQAPSPQPAPSLATNFAHQVAARMDGAILRYSERKALLKLAETLGIPRFEANLIIATVQHRRGQASPLPSPGAKRQWIPAVAFATILQGIIFIGAWWLVVR